MAKLEGSSQQLEVANLQLPRGKVTIRSEYQMTTVICNANRIPNCLRMPFVESQLFQRSVQDMMQN